MAALLASEGTVSDSTAGEGRTYLDGARAVAPLAMAIAALGIVFGYLARKAGLSAAQAIVMSATTFAGSPQFAAISVYSHGGTLLAAIVAAALLASRFAPMSATAGSALPRRLWQRFIFAQLVVDETWAVAYAGNARFERRVLVGAGVALYLVHVTATAVGATVGDVIGNPERLGIDAMAPALFVILIRPQLQSSRGWTVALASSAITLAAIPLVPPGAPLLIAIAASVGLGVYLQRSDREEKRGDKPA